MAKLRKGTQPETQLEWYEFFCPGCDDLHVYYTKYRGKKEFEWAFNGNMDLPSFTPSLLNRRDKGAVKVCHLYVTDGEIRYCNDCTHGLAGNVVPMVDLGGPA